MYSLCFHRWKLTGRPEGLLSSTTFFLLMQYTYRDNGRIASSAFLFHQLKMNISSENLHNEHAYYDMHRDTNCKGPDSSRPSHLSPIMCVQFITLINISFKLIFYWNTSAEHTFNLLIVNRKATTRWKFPPRMFQKANPSSSTKCFQLLRNVFSYKTDNVCLLFRPT